MDNKNSTILTDKQEMQLRKPIDDYRENPVKN